MSKPKKDTSVEAIKGPTLKQDAQSHQAEIINSDDPPWQESTESPLYADTFPTEIVSITDLRPHPRNYRQHPADQIQHIKQSITEHGFYRNVVIAKDGTILAGHGVLIACHEMGIAKIPVIRLPIEPDSSAALKVLAGDNEIAHLGEADDRLFTEILRDIKNAVDNATGLMGTGYDEKMLAGLVMVTRPASEIKDFDEAAEWVGAGMPEYEGGKAIVTISVSFRSEEDRNQFAENVGLPMDKRSAQNWATWWPLREREDLASVRVEQEG